MTGHEELINKRYLNSNHLSLSLRSALDAENEFLVQEALERLMEGSSLRLSLSLYLLSMSLSCVLHEEWSSCCVQPCLSCLSNGDSILFTAHLTQSTGRTVVIIAHRLSTIQNANAVAVLDQHRVAECGRHTELLGNKQGLFRKLMEKQAFLQEEQKRALS